MSTSTPSADAADERPAPPSTDAWTPPRLSSEQERELSEQLESSDERARFQALLAVGHHMAEVQRQHLKHLQRPAQPAMAATGLESTASEGTATTPIPVPPVGVEPVPLEQVVSPAFLERLEKRLADPSRLVREQVRALGPFTVAAKAAKLQEESPGLLPEERSPANGLLALVSFASATTGIMGTSLSLLHYYTMGSFPFPSALEVLLTVNMTLTLPFVLLGVLLLLPGRLQKQLAQGFAWVAIIGSLILVGGLQVAFDQWWSYLFLEEQQARYSAFLSPQQVGMALSPIIAGQLMQLFFGSKVLAEERAKRGQEPR